MRMLNERYDGRRLCCHRKRLAEAGVSSCRTSGQRNLRGDERLMTRLQEQSGYLQAGDARPHEDHGLGLSADGAMLPC